MIRTPPCPERELLARNVRELRARLGISQDELAHRAGVHRTYMSSVERKRRNVSMDVLSKIAAALGTDIPGLFLNLKEDQKELSD